MQQPCHKDPESEIRDHTMKSLMNTEAGKWTPFLALIVCAGGFLAQTDEDVRLSGPHAQTPIASPVAGEPLTGGQAGSAVSRIERQRDGEQGQHGHDDRSDPGRSG